MRLCCDFPHKKESILKKEEKKMNDILSGNHNREGAQTEETIRTKEERKKDVVRAKKEKENEKNNNSDVDTKKSDQNNPTEDDRVIPQLSSSDNSSSCHPNITYGEMKIAIRVLNAISALNNKKPQPTPKEGTGTGTGNGTGTPTNKKKRKQEEAPPSNHTTKNTTATTPAVVVVAGEGESENARRSGVEVYQHTNLRAFRKAIAGCLELHQRTMFNGSNEDDYYEHRNKNRSLKRQKMAERTLHKKYIAETALRKGRIDKLNKLKQEAQEEEQSKLQYMTSMIPDGHVDTAPTANVLMITHNTALHQEEDHHDNNEMEKEENTHASSTTNTTTKKKEGNMELEGQQGNHIKKEDHHNGMLATTTTTTNIQLPKLRSCYVCKVRYRALHHFYDQLCPSCAALNWGKRHQSVDLTGKIAIVTGSRVKIGYQTCLKLLRAGATVVATTRFPNSAAQNYQQEHDFRAWHHNLHIYGLDLRDVTGIEAFTRYLKVQYGKVGIDILINNACQTIRRPSQYYVPLVQQEQQLWEKSDAMHQSMLSGCMEFEALRRKIHDHESSSSSNHTSSSSHPHAVPAIGSGVPHLSSSLPTPPRKKSILVMMDVDTNVNDEQLVSTSTTGAATATTITTTEVTTLTEKQPPQQHASSMFEKTGLSHSAAMSQMQLVPEDVGVSNSILPPGVNDINGQQLDLRKSNSWLLKLEEISTPEIMECMLINTIAPFVLNSRLKPLMTTVPEDNHPQGRPDRYIINVSAMEGKFYRYKMANHPHTNMAKAALNMLTRTSSEELAKKHRIYMNSVDTGWINDENPLEKAAKTAATNLFQTPIDEIDAASRILDPIFVGVQSDLLEHASDDHHPPPGEGISHPHKKQKKKKKKDYGKFLKDYRETDW